MRPLGRMFIYCPRKLASVNAIKQICVIVILAYFTLVGNPNRKKMHIFGFVGILLDHF